ncbi:hypothetical protein [Oceanotoga teriensis]|jgi:flagellar protein FliO/FliZ|uniref:hypothetical protein n=1 Tax=Oceanotoga teriensis TaxID=515440 RepID=UPI002713E6AD|nr:hypothetical protein [Oceanotoga teriensis]MDO7977349.1 hypothetical protein [Oceanotoga teriensis]
MNLEYETINASSTLLKSSGGLSIFLWFLSMMALIIIMYILYRIIIKYSKNGVINSEIKILKKYYIEKNIYIGVLKLNEDYYYTLIGNNSTEIIRKLTQSEIENIQINNINFKDTLRGFMKKNEK